MTTISNLEKSLFLFTARDSNCTYNMYLPKVLGRRSEAQQTSFEYFIHKRKEIARHTISNIFFIFLLMYLGRKYPENSIKFRHSHK